jgi:hypothetical protein
MQHLSIRNLENVPLKHLKHTLATCIFHPSSVRHRAKQGTAGSGHLRLRQAWARHATAPLLAAWPHAAVGTYAAAAGLAQPASGTSERPDPSGGEEARRLSGGGHGEWVARWRRPQRADAMVQVSGAVERGVGKLGGVVEAKRGREIFF